MNQSDEKKYCSPTQCCSVEAIISVDDRGQMVLPKDVREKAGISPGDKLALVTWEDDGKICCMTLIKAEELGSLVRHSLEPVFGTTFDRGEEK